jgi:hypothetical protein
MQQALECDAVAGEPASRKMPAVGLGLQIDREADQFPQIDIVEGFFRLHPNRSSER